MSKRKGNSRREQYFQRLRDAQAEEQAAIRARKEGEQEQVMLDSLRYYHGNRVVLKGTSPQVQERRRVVGEDPGNGDRPVVHIVNADGMSVFGRPHRVNRGVMQGLMSEGAMRSIREGLEELLDRQGGLLMPSAQARGELSRAFENSRPIPGPAERDRQVNLYAQTIEFGTSSRGRSFSPHAEPRETEEEQEPQGWYRKSRKVEL